jgi:hypothetical protein
LTGKKPIELVAPKAFLIEHRLLCV